MAFGAKVHHVGFALSLALAMAFAVQAAWSFHDLQERQAARRLAHERLGALDLASLHGDAMAVLRRVDDAAATRARSVTAWALGTSTVSFLLLLGTWILLQRELGRRARAEEQLRALAERSRDEAVSTRDTLAVRLQLALDAARMGWWRYDPATRYAWWDERYKQIFGVEGMEQPNDEILKRLHPDDLPGVWAKVEAALDPVDSRPYVAEYRVVRPDGVVWVEAFGLATFEGDGAERRAVDLVGTVCDITERKRADQKLQRQLTRTSLLNRVTRAIGERQDLDSLFRVVLTHVEGDLPADAAWILLPSPDRERVRVVACGLKAEALEAAGGLDRVQAWPVGENGMRACLQARTVSEPDVTGATNPMIRRLAASGLGSVVCAPLALGEAVEGVLLAARAGAGTFESGDAEFLRQLGEHVALSMAQHRLMRDLRGANERLLASRQAALQQERLRAMGQMASGIAHDINNALGPIVLYADDLLTGDQPLDEYTRKGLASIQASADSIAKTVSRMRLFYRKPDTDAVLLPVDVNSLVREVVDLTKPRWHDIPLERGVVVDIALDLDGALPALGALDSELREALTNLVFNAVDALPAGGTITLRTRVHAGADGGDEVVVEVADTGVGMDDDTRRRCLEPFFTTKGPGGTGLGLSTVYGAVQRHDGHVEIQSHPDAGTTVRLFFPLRSATGPLASPEPEPPIGSLRILCIDDDAALRASLSDVLGSEGHVVTTAERGDQGVELFRRALAEGAAFDLVITDLGMPTFDGRWVAQAIKGCSCTTPVVLLTGWGERMRDDGEMPPGVDHVASKPPRVAELRRVLNGLCEPGHGT